MASATLLDAAGVAAALDAIATRIARSPASSGLPGPPGRDVALVGIRTGGLHLAERLQGLLAAKTGITPPLGAVDISLYRDDVFEGSPRPVVGRTELAFPLAQTTVVLVDDVLFTGRTIRAALDAMIDYGRPRAVRLAVLVDRGHRELPIQADYVGHAVETTMEQRVKVHLRERGEEDSVLLYERAPRS